MTEPPCGATRTFDGLHYRCTRPVHFDPAHVDAVGHPDHLITWQDGMSFGMRREPKTPADQDKPFPPDLLTQMDQREALAQQCLASAISTYRDGRNLVVPLTPLQARAYVATAALNNWTPTNMAIIIGLAAALLASERPTPEDS